MKQWFAIHTQPQKELLAQQHLIRQNFQVYLPRYKKLVKHSRKVIYVEAPLFPRYIFVAIDLSNEKWRSINGTQGVTYILTTNGRPSIVPERIISDLMSQEGADGMVTCSSLTLFIEGNDVRISKGAFKDQTATVLNLDDQQRVQLLLSFLGRELKIRVPLYAVEAA